MRELNHPLKYCVAALTLLGSSLLKADVPPAPVPPSPPAGYCSEIYGELNSDIQAFNQLLTQPPSWTPVSLGPPLFPLNLQVSDSNAGPAIGSPGFLNGVLPQLYEEQAMGAQSIMLQVGFPVLYAPFLTSQNLVASNYTGFYQALVNTIHSLGMKVVIENDILLTNDIQAGWPGLTQYFTTLSWSEYVQARATMAATIASEIGPDYLILAEEPDTEATQAGQPNLLNASEAAQMISAEIAAVQAVTWANPNMLIGAGFGAWPQASNANSVAEYTAAYTQLPLNFLDTHLYPINNESGGPVINDVLTIAQGAAAANMAVSMSEYWVWKMENSELNVLSADTIRGRNPFSFWAPLDIYFQQTMQTLANYTDFVFMAGDGPDYLFTYQTFGGTAQNGGINTCECTTTYCDAYDIIQTETQLAKTANESAEYTTTGMALYNDLVSPPDSTPPSTPTNLQGQPAYSLATLTWNPSTDNVGVAGYNIYRCTPATYGGACTGSLIGVSTVPSYSDQTLTQNTAYNYQVQAFDVVNNNSGLSSVLSVQTYRTSADSPTSVTAAGVSGAEISVTWTPPQDTTGLGKYIIFAGTTPTSLVQVATAPSSKTSFNYSGLSAASTYYFGVEADEQGINSPMSALATASTLPLPNPPNNVTVTVPSPTEIELSWQEIIPQTGLQIANYQVYEGTTSGQLTKIATVTSGTSYTERNLTPNTTYYYEIVAADTGHDDSVPSSQIAVTTLPMPPAPTNLSATTPAGTEIVFNWQWAALPQGLAAARYLVYCGTSPTNASQIGTEPSGTTYTFTYRSAKPGTTYYCYVVAVDTANDDSTPSAQLVVTTPPLPNAPGAVTATPGTGKTATVTVTWTETLPPNGLTISNYSIYRGTSPGDLSEVATRTTTSYIDNTVTAGQTYYYAVEATDTGRDVSPMSATASATPQ